MVTIIERMITLCEMPSKKMINNDANKIDFSVPRSIYDIREC